MFTSLALLYNLSLGGGNREIEILFLSDFIDSARSIISLVIWFDFLLEFKSLVPQCNIMWPESNSRIVVFTWWCMHPTLVELKGQTLTRHLWFSFLVSRKTFNFSPCCLQVWKRFLLRLVTTWSYWLYYQYYPGYCYCFHHYYYYCYYCQV